MAHEPVELDERPWVAQPLGTLARQQLALFLLPRHCLFRAGVQRLVAQLLEPGELLAGRRMRGCSRVVQRCKSLLLLRAVDVERVRAETPGCAHEPRRGSTVKGLACR